MWKFTKHEIKYWVKTPMLWIFFGIITLLTFGAVASDDIQIGGSIGNVFKNAPSAIQSYYSIMSIFCLLMTTAFMHASANRDFSTGMNQFIFSSPISESDYFFGKFFGTLAISIIPMLGVSLGALIGPLMPWVEPTRYGEVFLSGHLYGIIGFAIPNVIITGVMVYSLAVIFRDNIVSFLGAMVILTLYIISQNYIQNIDAEWIVNFADPFGLAPLDTLTKYSTVAEKNFSATPLQGVFLINRLLWIGLSVLLLLGTYSRFSFYSKKERVKKSRINGVEPVYTAPVNSLKSYSPTNTKGFSFSALYSMIGYEAKSIFKSKSFIIIVIIGLINVLANFLGPSGYQDISMYPTTYTVAESFSMSFYLYVIGIITFYSGVLVWKERDAKIHEIKDATPARTGLIFSSKLIALLLSIGAILAIIIVVGIITQIFHGYYHFDIGIYIKEILGKQFLAFTFLAIIALLFQYVLNNRYIAYIVFILFIVLNTFIWSVLEMNTNMLNFGSLPWSKYSDMNGFGPFVEGIIWYGVYWTLFNVLICFLMYAFVIRGEETGFKMRLLNAGQRLKTKRIPILVVTALFIATASFVYYNTEVLNENMSSSEREKRDKEYELTYKKYQGMNQPRWVSTEYKIDLFPYERDLFYEINTLVVNKSAEPISEIHFSYQPNISNLKIDIPHSNLKENNERLTYRIYSLSEAMQPGDTIAIKIAGEILTRGFENSVSSTSIVQNGSFFNNIDILPMIGYAKGREISSKNKRKKLGLPLRDRMPKLDENNLTARANCYISQDADWVDNKAVISTAIDQIAITSGSLIKEWTENNRRYFEYKLDKKALNFFSFLSARYEVQREKWKGVDIEVYYTKGHEYNVPNMISGMKKSLDYYTKNFGPYYQKQCRIVEFPRYASFAQAFPGTMPYSEGAGFAADLRNVTEDDVDVVFHTVAHEMAHQYWAHQLIGPEMRGTEMLSESFAQYSALMVMEKEYGRDKMKKFLRYEMNDYLRGRSGELEAERPLYEIEQQGYIHYNKGSVVMYYLKEMIGEENVNTALQNLLNEYAYQEPPYPTSLSAVRAFREVTPDSLQYLVTDLFETITLFSNKVTESVCEKVGNEYKVTIHTFSEKFRSDSLGKETPMALNDYIDVGIFASTNRKNILGKPLHYERVKITKAENTFSFMVKEKPSEVGIDPYNYLIDRFPGDNVKKVSIQ